MLNEKQSNKKKCFKNISLLFCILHTWFSNIIISIWIFIVCVALLVINKLSIAQKKKKKIINFTKSNKKKK